MTNPPDHFLLRDFAVAGRRDEPEDAAQAWKQLAENNWERVKQIVKAFRFSPGGKGLPEHERGSAATFAYLRVIAMGANFRSREPGAFYAALVTCVNNACMDYGRRELRHDKRSAGSFDQTFDPDGEAGPFDGVLAAWDAEQRRRLEDAVGEELSRIEAEQMVHWAIGQIANDNYREVLALTYIEKLPAEAIADHLGITMDNVYARRSRGLKELERILREHGS